jgi:hypothetical protein
MEVLVASHHHSKPTPNRRGRPKKAPDTDIINVGRLVFYSPICLVLVSNKINQPPGSP